MQELGGKTAVITGAASGIGFALAAACVAADMTVVLTDVEEVALHAAADELRARGGRVHAHVVDVSDGALMEQLASTIEAEVGPVHLLANNAGVGVTGRAWELTEDDWRWALGVGLWGVIHGIRAFVPGMIAHGEPAHILNTGSMMSLGTAPIGAPYQAAKHGVLAISESLQFDLEAVAPQVGVTVLCPGYVATRIGDAARNRPAALGGPGATRAKKATPGTAVRQDPAIIAELAIDAVRNGTFYALADWEIWEPLVRARFDAILDRRAPVPVKLP